ncbi:HNH endonuclease [Cytobacillus pseudoceanisediminis]|uniref:HNH endonuclease n=1 Tax=Cytobacillus pseudoceanisediminis TaxID=3051614 RepID=UPI00364DACC0
MNKLIPELEPIQRSREYNNYKENIRDKVIYEYLFNSRSHRWLDENIIGMAAEYSKGYQSMGILHYIGLKGKHKGLFEDISIHGAIEILEHSKVSDFRLIIEALKRKSGKNATPAGNDQGEITDDIEEGKEYPEGKEAYRLHRFRERDTRLIKEAKKLFKQKHGKLFCEACGINFEETYGDRGKDYIEAHHTKPVSKMKEGEKTRIEDIAMLCSNCHRMIHRSPFISVSELRKLVEANLNY